MCPTRFSLPDASFKLSVGLYCNQRTDAQPRFLTDKDDVFQTDFFDILLTHVASFRSYHRWLAITLYSASAIMLISAGYFNVP